MSEGLIVANILIGALLPHVVAVLNQSHWPAGTKSLIAFASCLVAAVISTAVDGNLDWENWTIAAGTIYALARTTYAGLWKPTGTVDAVETNTNLRRRKRGN